MITIESVEKEFHDVYLIADQGIIRILLAAALANRLPDSDPVWLMLVGPSSSGKTEFISSLTGILDYVHPISTLTTNTFASGMKRNDKETSLLFKVNLGIITLKDFTTILSMHRDARQEIMAQLREVYDGEFIKETGTGENITWRGKVGLIAGCTPGGYRRMTEFSDMGERFIAYSLTQPNRDELARRALRNASTMKEKRDHLKMIVAAFLEEQQIHAPTTPLVLDPEIEEDLLQVASFSTLARSPVVLNFKTGNLEFVPDPEMPARMAAQFYNLARSLAFMSGGKLTEVDKHIIYKIAIDSIPPSRRMVLKVLTKYESGGTDVLATALNYPTEAVKPWLTELTGLGVCDRTSRAVSGGTADKWELKPKYRKLLHRFANIPMLSQSLEPSAEELEEDLALREENKVLEEIDWGEWETKKAPVEDEDDSLPEQANLDF